MKRCPNCNDFALYDDNIMTCPVCDSRLVTYVRKQSGASARAARPNNNRTEEPIRPNNSRTEEPARSNHDREEEPVRPNNGSHAGQQSGTQSTVNTNTPPVFETRVGGRYRYRGLVTEISSHARLHSRLKKWVNAIFLGEPYQFGNTSHETVIRIEEFHAGRISGRRRDVIYYGDVEGRFYHGDDVTITAKRRGDRYIVTRMYLNETETAIRPTPQISSAVIRLMTLLVIALLVGFVISGTAFALLKEVIIFVVLILVLREMVRAFFRG